MNVVVLALRITRAPTPATATRLGRIRLEVNHLPAMAGFPPLPFLSSLHHRSVGVGGIELVAAAPARTATAAI